MLILMLSITVVVIAGICCVLTFYTRTINDEIFEAGSESLEETYREVGQTFAEISESRWNYLEQLGDYLEDVGSEDSSRLEKMIEELKEKYGFTGFYLVSDNGSYITVDGEEGYIDLGRNLFSLVDGGQRIVTDGSLPRQDNMLFYAVPVEENTYQGFTYMAVAFGYDQKDMSEVLEVSAYEGRSEAYIAYSNGRVAIDMGTNEMRLKNILSSLAESNLTEEELARVENDFQTGATNTLLVRLSGKNYYLSYQAVGFQNWMLVSFTPTESANLAMNDIRANITKMLAYVLGVLFVVILSTLALWFWKSISRKNSMLEERDLIFSLISQNMDDIYILLRRETQEILYVSPNVERLLGVSVDEVWNDYWILTECCPDPNKWLERGLLDKILPGETLTREANLRNRQTGQEGLYLFSLYRPKGKHSNVAVGIISNRTKEQQVRREIEDALQVAKAANQSKTAFLSNMSHDIRTPINAIVGFAILLDRDAENPEKVREHTKKITASSKHLLGLINDVLDMSKIEAGKTTLNMEELDVEELVGDLESIIRTQAKAKNQTLKIQKKLEFEGIVMADRLRVSQVLLNILSNAVKYTPNEGIIIWRVESTILNSEQFVRYRFTIQDNGIGMSPEYLKTIFEPFTRETGSVVNKIQGTGLGMAITKNLVSLMGGTIHVDSVQNEGSTFEVMLQLKIVDKKKAVRENTEKEEVSLEGMRILAAEDNELNAEILEELLSMEGVECDLAENGQEALEKFVASEPDRYDLILMDVQMPVMNGYEATKAIRRSAHERAKTIPIIAMTANAFSEDVQEALASGMNEHLAKPVDVDVLRKTLSEVYAAARKK